MKKRLVVGLGNPGDEYEGTRHNIGFEVLDALAMRSRQTWRPAGPAMAAEAGLKGRKVVLARPLTYVNRSGEAVSALLGRYGLSPRELLVVVDDLHLPAGTLRLRGKGSSAGHNGMQDIIDRLGTRAFARLRIGIGDTFPKGGQVDYVLAPFSHEQRPRMDEAVDEAVQAVQVYVSEGLSTAMNRFN